MTRNWPCWPRAMLRSSIAPGAAPFSAAAGHRYADMLAAGINVAVGTDSLASNDSLDMFAEMRRLKRQGRVDNSTILRMATMNGARALGWQDRIGSLEPGKYADWVAVELPELARMTYWKQSLTQPCPVIETVIGGRVVFSRPPASAGI